MDAGGDEPHPSIPTPLTWRFETLTPAVLAWIVAVMALAGLVQGALGLGLPIVATPLIAFVSDIRTAVIVVLLPCVATVLVSMLRGVRLADPTAAIRPSVIITLACDICG